ncbi:MAG: hypothetical protein SFW66_08865 [Gammaproteobacteria bacterium]|nr:hypothetical protein [Gammaproteobacteria bacterium]
MTSYVGPRGGGSSGSGDVVGPGSSTNNAVALFDGATGQLLKNSATTIDPSTGVVSGLIFPNTGVPVRDTNSSHNLLIAAGSDLTADRTLTLTTGDSARAVTFSNDFIFAQSTFTPTVTLSGAGTVPVFTQNVGVYSRIGNRVFVDVWLEGDGGAEGSGTSEVRVALPITASSTNLASYTNIGTWVSGTAEFMLGGIVAASGTYITLYYWSTVNQALVCTGGDFVAANTKNVRLNFNYYVG